MSRRVGIVTLNGFYNYGNRLQNFALTRTIEKLGYDVKTIWSGEEIDLKRKIQYFIIKFFPFNKKWKRERKFWKFNKKYIKSINYSNKIDNFFDIYVAGSDQVWNYESVKNNLNYLIPFCNNQKLISYAASLGNSSLPDNYISTYYKYLNKYDSISVREKKGKELLENVVKIKKNIEVHIDPTFLIDSTDWEKISQIPKKMINEKYILCYFLGTLENNYKQAINKYANINNLKIINLLDKNDNFYCSGPEEFLYLVNHASLICTDSFHSSVFSFIFGRPFVVFKRKGEFEKMYSRIENLLYTFKLQNREFNGNEINEKNILCDYSKSYEILNNEKLKSLNYLKESLK